MNDIGLSCKIKLTACILFHIILKMYFGLGWTEKKTLQKDLPLENFISQDVILRWFLFKAVEDNTRLLESRLNKQTPNEIKIEKEVNKLQEKLDKMNLELEKVSGVGGGFNDRGVYYFSKIIPKF